MTDQITIEITKGFRWSYFQWFLLGFHILEDIGIDIDGKKYSVKLQYKLPFWSTLLLKSNNNTIIRLADHFRRTQETDTYNMEGIISFPDGKKKKFAVDSADAPYLFDKQLLEKCDAYFKMQCPIDLQSDTFTLAPGINIPWCDHAHVDESLPLTAKGERKSIPSLKPYLAKIHPLMVGPRQLSKGCCYKVLKAGYDNYLKDRSITKSGKIMCYFGNALGPKPEENVTKPDWDWEADIMGYFGGKVSHPNEKRAKAADMIGEIPGCDARVISRANADTGLEKHEELIIPLPEFCKHISKFQYNLNISGYRLSVPNRFIESFMVGTAILTDQLSLRWYKPFDSEVKETVEMGYLPMDKVDWDKFSEDLNDLPEADGNKVIDAFNSKWRPDVVAKYIIDTVRNS